MGIYGGEMRFNGLKLNWIVKARFFCCCCCYATIYFGYYISVKSLRPMQKQREAGGNCSGFP